MSQISTLRKNYEFNRVYRKGSFLNSRSLTLYYLRRGRPGQSVGITISRKVKGSVRRNQLKRWLRELYRLHQAELQQGLDIILLARLDPEECNYHELCRDFEQLARRAKILDRNSPQEGENI